MDNRVLHYIKSISGGVVSPGEDRTGPGLGESKHWTNTVFLQLYDPEMCMVLEELLNQAGLYCEIGEPNSPDIIAVPACAVVIDRYVLGKEQWQDYLEYRRDVNGMDVCIIVDSLTDLDLPEDDPLIDRMALKTLEDARNILTVIKRHRRAYLNR